jgi:hypothetical protein
VKLHGVGGHSQCFFDESGQHPQQKCYRTDAQHCQRNFHRVTGTPVAENCSRRNCSSPRVIAGSKVHKEFVRSGMRGARYIPDIPETRTRWHRPTRFRDPTFSDPHSAHPDSATPLCITRLGVILSGWPGLRRGGGQFEERQTGRGYHQFALALRSSIPGSFFP